MEYIFYLLIPVSSIGLMFLKDDNEGRKEIMNVLLIMNAFFFLSPLTRIIHQPSDFNTITISKQRV